MTVTHTTADQLITIQYEVDKPTLEQIVALETITPWIGPTGTMFMIRAAVRCAGGAFYEHHTMAELAEALGISGISGQMLKTLRRLERFSVISFDGTNVVIDRWPRHDT